MYKTIGYYICEIAEVPNWLGIMSKEMLSVSGCLATTHPDLRSCYFVNKHSEQLSKDYADRLCWNKEQIEAIKQEINVLIEKELAIDGRFKKLEDAKYFYETYFMNVNCVVVSVATTEEFCAVLQEEFEDYSATNKVAFLTDTEDLGDLLGYDILGWDISGFHSFLCNHLQKELPTARFNNMTLLENEFEEVVEFSRRIQGKGEPVEWIPCRIAAVTM